MRRAGSLAVLIAMLIVALFPGGGTATASEEADKSPNVRQLARVDMLLSNGEPWETGLMAFQDDLLVVGSGFDQYTGTSEETSLGMGFAIFRILPKAPYLKQLSFHRCPSGEQGDISIWKSFVFLSVNTDNSRKSPTCNNTDDSVGKKGIRVVDISDPRRPRQVRFIETVCGSGTHSLVPGKNGVVYIYDANGGACPTGTALPSFRMDVVKFNPARPERAAVVSTPHLEDQDGCMDIAILMSRKIAACMMLARAALYDITDPYNPRFLSQVQPTGASNLSQAGFTWDGNVLVLSDQGEAAGFASTCAEEASVPDLYFYSIEDAEDPSLLGTYKAERVVVPNEERRLVVSCDTWDFSMIPMTNPSRYVMGAGLLAGGMSLIDLSTPTAAEEVAYYLATEGPLSASDIGHAYWYKGRFYAGEWQTRKGIRVFKIDGFNRNTVRVMDRYNPQTQVAPRG